MNATNFPLDQQEAFDTHHEIMMANLANQEFINDDI